MGFKVEIRLPTKEGEDWADVWMHATQRLGNIMNALLTIVIQCQSDAPYKVIQEMLNH